jgi:hypothetical protein
MAFQFVITVFRIISVPGRSAIFVQGTLGLTFTLFIRSNFWMKSGLHFIPVFDAVAMLITG